MLYTLIAIGAIALISLILNGTYIAHELGWFPHGKDRKKPFFTRKLVNVGDIPTLEEKRKSDRDFQTQSPFNKNLRRFAHRSVYEFKDAAKQMKEVLSAYRENPSSSKKDDVLNLMNVILTSEEPSEDLEKVINESIQATQEPVFNLKRKED